jgi:hypothetical protein
MAFCPRNVTGVPVMNSCSLPKAMKLPVTVSPPKSTSKPRAAICPCPMVLPWPPCQYSATPTSVAASAPKRWETAMR